MTNVAILVGYSRYRSLGDLECCEADLEAVEELVRAAGKYEHVKKMLNVESGALKDGIREFLDNSQHADEILFYFTGHGFQNKSGFFFCPSDFDPVRPNETGLSTDDLHLFLRAVGADLVVKVIDACHSGTLLVKSDGAFFNIPKEGFNKVIQIASCLESQFSLTGSPLSVFTESFRDAVLSKAVGPVHYSDIVASLRDKFLDNESQTPHFVFQGTGREQFSDSAARFATLRAEIEREAQRALAAGAREEASERQELSLVEKVRKKEEGFSDREMAQAFIDRMFGDVESTIGSSSDISDFYDVAISYHDDFDDLGSREFIARILDGQSRPDNFVAASISRKRKNRQLNALAQFRIGIGLFEGDGEYIEDVELLMNCDLNRIQCEVSFIPKFKVLKKWVLVVSCAPSLDICYVFENVTEHALRNWGEFEAEGRRINRRWYEMHWSQSTEYLVEKICSYALDSVQEHIKSISDGDGE